MNAPQRIAVAGATGRVGSHVTELLEAGGHDVVRISRSNGVDVVTGEGLDDALAGVSRIVDAATGPSPDEQEATAFFTASARNLQDAARRAGVERIVVVSIVGCDRFAGGYNAAKVVQEKAMLSGPVPARVLRATQFHEFVSELLAWTTQGDVANLPEFRTQLVAARTVAEELVKLVTGPGTGLPITEIAGPRVENLAEMAKLLVAHRGADLRIEQVSDPDDHDAQLWATGGSLPGPDAKLAGPTFEEWLASTDAAAAPAEAGTSR